MWPIRIDQGFFRIINLHGVKQKERATKTSYLYVISTNVSNNIINQNALRSNQHETYVNV